jgi:hypothetical protein
VLVVIFFLAYLCSPRYGLFRKLLHARHFHDESLARWRKESPDEAAGKK